MDSGVYAMMCFYKTDTVKENSEQLCSHQNSKMVFRQTVTKGQKPPVESRITEFIS